MEKYETVNNVNHCYVCKKMYFEQVTICSKECQTVLCEHCGKSFHFDETGKKQFGHNMKCKKLKNYGVDIFNSCSIEINK